MKMTSSSEIYENHEIRKREWSGGGTQIFMNRTTGSFSFLVAIRVNQNFTQ